MMTGIIIAIGVALIGTVALGGYLAWRDGR